MMLHQDGSTHEGVSGKKWDLIVTMDQKVKRLTWVDEFGSPEKAWYFYSSTNELWWYEIFAEEKRKLLDQIVFDEMKKKKITGVSIDVVFYFGKK